MDPLVTTTLAVSGAAAVLPLAALFNKNTSKVTKTLSAATVLATGLTVTAATAAENSVGGDGLVFALLLPVMAVANTIGATWSAAALYEGSAVRRRIEREAKTGGASAHVASPPPEL